MKKIFTLSASLAFALYAFSMFIAPAYVSGGDWIYIQRVWERWQSFNAAIIALGAAILGLWGAMYSYRKQREDQLAASKAFLAQALSDLSHYCKDCMKYLDAAWDYFEAIENGESVVFNNALPRLAESYKPIFADCIKYADNQVRDRLAYILLRLQIHNSRFLDLHRILIREDTSTTLDAPGLMPSFCHVAAIGALVNKLFPYARFEKFHADKPSADDYLNVINNSDLSVGDYDGLLPYLERYATAFSVNPKEAFDWQ